MSWIVKSIGWFGRAFSWLIIHLPRPIRSSLGAALGLIWYDILRIRREVVISNLAIAFPDMSRVERVRLGRRAMMNFGRSVLEYAYLPFLPHLPLAQIFVTENIGLVDQALKEGHGLIVITLHLGHGDLACAGLSRLGYPIFMVSKFFKLKWLNDMWFGMRAKVGTKFIPPRNSSYTLLKALKNNGVVVIPLDQFTGPPIGVKTTFFGKETGTAAGPALMAERAKAPVVIACSWRMPDGRHMLHFENRLDVQFGSDHDRSLVEYTQAFNDQLETFVRNHPDQWMWIHKRWKRFVVT